MGDTCTRGHRRTPANTYTDPRGYARCRPCAREDQRRFADTHPDARLTRYQIGFLKRIESGKADKTGYNSDVVSPATVEALARRGYIQRTGGAWQLTEAGRTCLAALVGA